MSGVLQLHTHRFIHRDIKTDNVFYIADIEGEISQCAIGDLDTVTQLMKGKGPNECIGTPGYTAPGTPILVLVWCVAID